MNETTFTGREVDPFNLRPCDIELETIAHALANTCRFNGHTPRFYSVAEHAVRVSHFAWMVGGPRLALLALHHDDAEAYLGDQIRPLKTSLGWRTLCNKVDPFVIDTMFETVESNALRVIYSALGLIEDYAARAAFNHAAIKRADDQALALELMEFWGQKERAEALAPRFEPPWRYERAQFFATIEAKAEFLDRHRRLVAILSSDGTSSGK